MAKKYSKGAEKKVAKVMHELKEGTQQLSESKVPLGGFRGKPMARRKDKNQMRKIRARQTPRYGPGSICAINKTNSTL